MKPLYGRKETLEKSVQLLEGKKDPIIVEIGVSRDSKLWLEEGHSTPFFAWWIKQHQGKLWAVDIDPKAVHESKKLIREHQLEGENIQVLCADGIEFLHNFKGSIDLLYLDGWDYSLDSGEKEDQIRKESEIRHLECFQKGAKNLKEGSLILIDDIFDHETFFGKGRILIPYLLERGFSIDPISYHPLNYGEIGGNFPDHIHQFLLIKR